MTYPAFLRVTLKAQYDTGEWVDGEYICPELSPLGFAQVYEPELKTFAKKQQTQDNWAYGTTHRYNEDGLVVALVHKWTNVDDKRVVVTSEQIVPEHLQPRIIRNTPLQGFRLVKSVSRCSTSNKLWRVLDPRGFQLEISTANLEDLMMDCVIDHGLITVACVWEGKTKVKLVRA